MRRALPLLFAFPALFGMATRALANSGGVAGDSGAASGRCTDCHGGGKAPKVAITGPASLGAGDTGEYLITISSATPMAQKFAGADVSASAGQLEPGGGQNTTKLLSGELVQDRLAGPFDPLQFKFSLVAPEAPGPVTLFGAGLSADGDGTTSGDGAATTMFMLTVVPASSADLAAAPSPDLASAPEDLAGEDLAGADLAAAPVSDLAAAAVDAISSATPAAGKDLAMAPVAAGQNEPRWSCGCQVGGARARRGVTALFDLVLGLALGAPLALRRRRPPRR